MNNPFSATVSEGIILLSGLGPNVWGMTLSDAGKLRDALTLALAPVGAGEPRLPCRVTKGRKACRSCGAVSGQAHTEGCAEILQPPEEGERRVGPPERRAAWAASRHPATELTYRGTVRGTMQSGPPSVDNLPRRDPPTPEEKAAGEWAGEYRVAADPLRVEPTTIHAASLGSGIKYPPIEPPAYSIYSLCEECFMHAPAHSFDCSKA